MSTFSHLGWLLCRENKELYDFMESCFNQLEVVSSREQKFVTKLNLICSSNEDDHVNEESIISEVINLLPPPHNRRHVANHRLNILNMASI